MEMGEKAREGDRGGMEVTSGGRGGI